MTKQSTVQLLLRPTELLRHLRISHETKGAVTLEEWPYDSFQTDWPFVLNVLKREYLSGGLHKSFQVMEIRMRHASLRIRRADTDEESHKECPYSFYPIHRKR